MRDDQPTNVFTEGRDYYVDEAGLYVFTSAYLRRRGTCCGNKCRHCPYAWVKVDAAQIASGERPTETAAGKPRAS